MIATTVGSDLKLPFRIEITSPIGPCLYVDAGTDPKDGAPMTLARAAAPHEVAWWQSGQYWRIAETLRAQGVSIATERPGWWRRLTNRLRRLAGE